MRSQTTTIALFLAFALTPLTLPMTSVRGADCNGNGRNDRIEIGDGDVADCNANEIPDGCEVLPVEYGLWPGIGVGQRPRTVVLHDLDGDGDLDAVTGNAPTSGASVSVLLNEGERRFARADYEAGSRLFSVAAGDLDADGDADLITVSLQSLHILLNNGDGTFADAVELPARRGVFAVQIGDLNGDRINDLAVANKDRDHVAVFLATENGGFSEPTEHETGDLPADLALADFDGDGDLDIATVNRSSADLTVLVNDGSAAFVPSGPFDAGGSLPREMVVRDFTGDGFPDIAVSAAEVVAVLVNDTHGGFTVGSQFLTQSTGVAAGDFDRDRDNDVVVGVVGSNSLRVLINGGAGDLVTFMDVELEGSSRGLEVGDLDGDDDLDLAAAVETTGALYILWNGEPGAISLTSKVVPMGPRPHSAILADVDGDGHIDCATGDGNGHTVTLLMNDGEGNLAVRRTYNTSGYLNSIADGDFDNDGDVDLVVADHGSSRVQVLLNNGNGTYQPHVNYITGAGAFFVIAGDLNGDGYVEIVCTNESSNTCSILFNNGDGTFQRQVPVRVGSRPLAATLGDWDGDGDLDMAVANANSSAMTVLSNDGTGTFTIEANHGVPEPWYVNTADFDNDGDLDLAVASQPAGRVTIFKNESNTGTFSGPFPFPVGQPPYSLVPADINGDGLQDIVTANEDPGTISVMLNRGDAEFELGITFTSGTETRFCPAADLDGDGDVDLVGINHVSRNVTVFYNQATTGNLEPFLERLCTPRDFYRMSIKAERFVERRVTKFIVPADPSDPDLLAPMVQNVRLHELHQDFLRAHHADRFPIDQYDALVNRRATRKYFVGNLYLLSDDRGHFYGFNILTAFQDNLGETPTLEEVQGVYETLSTVIDLGSLYYYPNHPITRGAAEQWGKTPFPVFIFDPTTLIDFEAYTVGVGYGRVKLFTQEEFQAANERGGISFQDILGLGTTPRDIEGVVSGLLTEDLQEELSHVRIRMANRGTPNAFVKNALTELLPWQGQLVRLEVTASDYTITPATQEEAEDFWKNNQPTLTELPTVDPEFDEILTLEEIGALDLAGGKTPIEARFGGKAANFARLQRVLSDPQHPEMHQYVEKGFAIPMKYYFDFVTTNHLTSALDPNRTVSYAEYLEELVADDEFKSNSAFRFDALEVLREHMKDDSVVPLSLVRTIALKIVEVFETSTDRTRFRSSSTVEDSLEFNGAGLYDSTSGCAADDLDVGSGGPSRCDPTRENERGAARALRRVWASLWNFRAFEERQFFGIPHELAAMGVLNNQAFVDEKLNGVAFTGNIANPLDRRYVVTAQAGESSVVSPEPGVTAERSFLTVEDGEVVRIDRVGTSSLVPPGTVVMTDAQLTELGKFMWFVDQRFPLELGPYPREAVLLDFEFKIDSADNLAVKQVRPFLLNVEVPPTPTFYLDIPDGTEVCGVFAQFRDAADVYQLLSVVKLRAGRHELATDSNQFFFELFDEVRLGPEQEIAVPQGPGRFTVDRTPEGKTTAYRFRYEQDFLLSGDRALSLSVPSLTFHATGEEPVMETRVVDDEFITRSMNLEGFLDDSRLPYSSCTYDLLPLFEILIELEDGSKIQLRERFEIAVQITETGPANLVFAALELGGRRVETADYWDLVYSAEGHNLNVVYWVVPDNPITLEGVPGPVHAVEVIAAQEEDIGINAQHVDPEVHYLDANFELLAQPTITHYSKTEVKDPPTTPFRRGDANADGGVGIADAIFVLNHLFAGGTVPTCRKTADANDDGGIGIADPISILNHLFAGAGPLPEPFGACGEDPTEDPVTCTAYGACE